VVGLDFRTPVQSTLQQIRDLEPISVRKLLGTEIVMVGGADLVAELNDDTRFGKGRRSSGPMRRIVGEGLATVEDDSPN
jgi:hypothetical protein